MRYVLRTMAVIVCCGVVMTADGLQDDRSPQTADDLVAKNLQRKVIGIP